MTNKVKFWIIVAIVVIVVLLLPYIATISINFNYTTTFSIIIGAVIGWYIKSFYDKYIKK